MRCSYRFGLSSTPPGILATPFPFSPSQHQNISFLWLFRLVNPEWRPSWSTVGHCTCNSERSLGVLQTTGSLPPEERLPARSEKTLSPTRNNNDIFIKLFILSGRAKTHEPELSCRSALSYSAHFHSSSLANYTEIFADQVYARTVKTSLWGRSRPFVLFFHFI